VYLISRHLHPTFCSKWGQTNNLNNKLFTFFPDERATEKFSLPLISTKRKSHERAQFYLFYHTPPWRVWISPETFYYFTLTSLNSLLTFLKPWWHNLHRDWLRIVKQRGRSSSPGMFKDFYSSISSRPPLGPTRLPLNECRECLGRG
jgi:hypothetical protein